MYNPFFHIYKITLTLLFLNYIFFTSSTAQIQSETINLDTVKAGRFDTGKMWTFDYPPSDYFEQEYGFRPDEEWYDHLRMSALRFASYCSASFVSEDGLIMTNHHCARESVTGVDREDEDLHVNGFIANSLEEERPIPGLFVDQLISIEDVTEEILSATEGEGSEREKLELEAKKMQELEDEYSDEEDLYAMVVPLYNGGKFSLYGYKRYTDVRLVFVPESQAGYFGGDYDNFTFPRYNLDCSFFRVYDKDGKPLKTESYFKWSGEGIQPGEPIFVVGNPGSTNRLNTVSQLEFYRDITYPRMVEFLKSMIAAFKELTKGNPESEREINDQLLSYENSLKAYSGMLAGLRDPVLMQRKKDFEKNFNAAVQSDTELNKQYGDLWDKIDNIRSQLTDYTNQRLALSVNDPSTPHYFFIADELLYIAEELKLPENERTEGYRESELDSTLELLIPADFNEEENKGFMRNKIDRLYQFLSENNEFLERFTGGNKSNDAVEYILSNSKITTVEGIKALVEKGPDAILNSDDPFIYFVNAANEIKADLDNKMDALTIEEESYNQQLGKALFEVYGTSIPPDATFTLRISDGVVKGFEYNGTISPTFTTFYGLLDRYYSFNKKFPWTINERWLDAPPDFDFSTPLNFVATSDVVGGASGSPVINKNAEIVGVAFDGNIQSLPGDFIYNSEDNRTIAVSSEGIMEAIKDLYEVERLAEELKSGKISE